jgi:putative transposase
MAKPCKRLTASRVSNQSEISAMAKADISAVFAMYKYRLLPEKRQHRALERILEDQRQLYNAAKQEREDCFRKTGQLITYYSQCKSLTIIRRDCPDFSRYPVTLQRGALKRLDEAFRAFFRRVRSGSKAGFPRFKSPTQFNSFQFPE